jgi:cobalt-zinc-cadmium efflux system outer membrane protein
VPDVTIGGGYRWLAGPDESAFVADVSIPLPIFHRNQGAVLEAQRRADQAREERRSTEVRLATELSTTFEALGTAHAQVERLEKEILPGAAEAFDTLREGYLEGRFSYLDVLDAQRTLVAARAQHVGALADYHRAVAAVERLIGEPLAGGEPTASTKGTSR